MTSTFVVSVELNITADSPADAARLMLEDLRDVQLPITDFTVADGKRTWEVHFSSLADEVEAVGMPSVADDIREGMPLDTVLARLRAIGEGSSKAARIIDAYKET